MADFLANQMNSASITNEPVINNEQGYTAAYIEDHWRVTPKLTVQLGLRYDYFQPYKEMAGYQANFVPLAGTIGTGVATYLIPGVSRNALLPPAFLALLQKDHINIQYDDNSRLATEQKTAFAPRIGLAYQVDSRTVVRAGFGLFYGAIQSAGSNANIGENFPFVLRGNLVTPSCTAMNPCPSLSLQGATLENGLTNQLAQGLQNFVSSPSLFGTDPNIKTPYTGSFNIFVQHAFSNSLSASVGYVGNFSRHLITLVSPNGAYALITAGLNSQAVSPFPDFSGGNYLTYAGNSSYHSLQATLNKRFARGLSFLSTFTWSHALDDSTDPLGGGVGYRATNLIPIKDEYTNSNYDSRLRYNFNGNYELPFGHGRAHLSQSRVLDAIAGGWSASLTFISQTGTPFTVGPNISTASGSGSRAISIESPFTAGGSPNATNPTITCAQRVHTLANWYNPCAFMNPLAGKHHPGWDQDHQLRANHCFYRRFVEYGLWSRIRAHQHVHVQELHHMARAVLAISSRRLQHHESPELGESLHYRDQHERWKHHRTEEFSEQHARLPVLPVVIEICFLNGLVARALAGGLVHAHETPWRRTVSRTFSTNHAAGSVPERS